MRDTVKLTFKVHFETNFGQNLYLIGNTDELGSWSDFTNKMEWSHGHIWHITVTFEAMEFIEYKYVVISEDRSQRWENGSNRQILL